MNAVVQPILKPDRASMLQHLEHLFGGYLDGFHDGKIELAWTSPKAGPDGRHKLGQAELFGTDQFDELVHRAAVLNETPMCNVYIGAALRHPNTAPVGRCSDSDAWALTAVYADLDDEGATAKAKHLFGNLKPSLVVQTGREPYGRAQIWWRLDAPLTDPDAWESQLKGIALGMLGDPTVCNPGRVMRLAGSIAWPVKDGRTLELTRIIPLREPGMPAYSLDAIAAKFPPLDASSPESVAMTAVARTESLFGSPGKVMDGRDAYMRDTVLAVMIQFMGENGAAPTPQELFDLAWPQYAENADLERPGHGPAEMVEKCKNAVVRFERGQIKGLKSVDDAVAIWNRKTRPMERAAEQERRAEGASGNLLITGAEFVSGFTPPSYLIDGIVQRGYLYSLTARTGHGKTAVDLYLCQCIARATAAHGRKVKQGAVLFCAGENADDIRARWIVLADTLRFDIAATPVFFIDGIIDIKASTPRIVEEANRIGDVILVVVDTAAAYFTGDDPNNNAQQVAFARDLRALTVQIESKPALVVNCHPVKNASKDNLIPMGGSALINEVDGNLTLWADGEGQTTLHWQGKFRGPEFEPMTFKIETAFSDRVVDSDGRRMPSVVAGPMSDMEIEMVTASSESDENVLLAIIGHNKGASVAAMARKASWVNQSGAPNKAKVVRTATRLLESKLIARYRGSKYAITSTGKKELGWDDE